MRENRVPPGYTEVARSKSRLTALRNMRVLATMGLATFAREDGIDAVLYVREPQRHEALELLEHADEF